jgi:hypothetical protein
MPKHIVHAVVALMILNKCLPSIGRSVDSFREKIIHAHQNPNEGRSRTMHENDSLEQMKPEHMCMELEIRVQTLELSALQIQRVRYKN